MKKAEIIKNGNVNLKPIKTKVDWRGVKLDFFDSKVYAEIADHEVINVDRLLDWFKKRIEKELNQ